jgi:uncharacterized protein (TIGR00290 family)
MKKAFCSWSGGKDSYLALSRAKASGIHVTHLVTMFDESGERSRSHAVSRKLMRRQAEALGLEIVMPSASWQTYESVFVETISELRQNADCEIGVFGDIDLQAHREWEEKVCSRADIEPVLPLWGETRLSMVDEFLESGSEAVVICVNERYLDSTFCGRTFDRQFIADLPDGIDACGENGEFHTFAFNGTIFAHPVPYRVTKIYRHVSTFPGGDESSSSYANLEIDFAVAGEN